MDHLFAFIANESTASVNFPQNQEAEVCNDGCGETMETLQQEGEVYKISICSTCMTSLS